jgi:hypothetical protein
MCHHKPAPKVFLSWINPGPPIIVSEYYFPLQNEKNHNYQTFTCRGFSSVIAWMVYFANCWSCIHPKNAMENEEHQGSRQLKSLLPFCRLSPTNLIVTTVYSFWSWIPNDSSGLSMLWKLASSSRLDPDPCPTNTRPFRIESSVFSRHWTCEANCHYFFLTRQEHRYYEDKRVTDTT